MYRLIAAVIVAGLFPLVSLIRPRSETQRQNAGLAAIARERDFLIGAAVSAPPLRDEAGYRETLAREFNLVVAENAFKFEPLHPARDRYSFSEADAIVDFADRNGIKLRGHTLIWHRQLPQWVTAGNWTRDAAIALLRDHIQKVVGRYRGRIRDWDVVNEAVDDEQKDGLRRDSFWYRTIGPEYIALAFKTAHEVDPDARLYYNDFSNEGKGKKSDLVYKLLQDLKRQGVPIDGIGWQMHLPAGFKMKPEHRENAQRLVEMGLELAITELDVRVKMPPTQDALAQQAETYRDVASFCLTQPGCGALIMWGFTDKHSWVPSVFPGEGNALLFDENLQAKAAYASLRDALTNAVNGAPRINEAILSDGALKLRGDNFEKGSMIFADGRSLRPSAVQAGEMIFKDFQRVSSGRQTMILQVQAKGGKLSAPRNLAVETGMLTELK